MSEPRYWIELGGHANDWFVMCRGTPQSHSMPFAERDLARIEEGIASQERRARELAEEAAAMRAAIESFKALAAPSDSPTSLTSRTGGA